MHSSVYQNSCIFNPRFDINSSIISRYKLSVPRREINLGFRELRQDLRWEDGGFLCQCTDTITSPSIGGRRSRQSAHESKHKKGHFGLRNVLPRSSVEVLGHRERESRRQREAAFFLFSQYTSTLSSSLL